MTARLVIKISKYESREKNHAIFSKDLNFFLNFGKVHLATITPRVIASYRQGFTFLCVYNTTFKLNC